MASGRVLSALAMVGAAIALASCDSSDQPPNSLVVDWKRGAYDGVWLGDDSANVRRMLGRPPKRGRYERFEPIGENFYEIGGLTNFASPDISSGFADFETLRYRRRVFATTGDRITALGTTDPRARTPEGVAIGDNLQLVERRYANADCFIQNKGTHYVNYPLCKVRVCAGRLLAFGGEPIKSIWLAVETTTGLKSCRPPQ
jgi:hypothetical protein